MANSPFFTDLHVHSSLRPFRYRPLRNIFDSIPYDEDPNYLKQLPFLLKVFLGGMLREYGVPSQANLQQCLESKTRVIAISLYPPERNLFDLRKFISVVLGKNDATFGAAFTQFQKEVIQDYINLVENNDPIDYCGELDREYRYLVQESTDSSGLTIATDFQHLKETLDAGSDELIAVLTIEGLHSLAKYDRYTDLTDLREFPNKRNSPDYQKYLTNFTQGITILKNWHQGKHTPFFVTFAHHFWNLLCGHARSFAGVIRKMAIDQECGRNMDITALGIEVMDLLLSRENGRQILIDVKHMSAKARRTFYHLRQVNYVEKNNSFPIICSHAAISGVPTLAQAINQRDHESDNTATYFNVWSINLCDEDILQIFNSGGLIGIVLHEDRMPGGIPKHRIQGFKKAQDHDRLRDEYLKLIMSNILHIIRVCNDVQAWNMICLGSDFDGAINPMETYPNVQSYVRLGREMRQFLHQPLENRDITPPLLSDDVKRLQFNLTPEEIVVKIMQTNMMGFLEAYFNEDYLLRGNLMIV